MKIWPFTKLGNLPLANFLSVVASLIFILSSYYLVWVNREGFPLAVPLWFSREWGEERLAEPTFLWLLPTTSLVLLVLNFFIWRFFKNREPILFLMILWATPVVSGLLFYALLKIILVVS